VGGRVVVPLPSPLTLTLFTTLLQLQGPQTGFSGGIGQHPEPPLEDELLELEELELLDELLELEELDELELLELELLELELDEELELELELLELGEGEELLDELELLEGQSELLLDEEESKPPEDELLDDELLMRNAHEKCSTYNPKQIKKKNASDHASRMKCNPECVQIRVKRRDKIDQKMRALLPQATDSKHLSINVN